MTAEPRSRTDLYVRFSHTALMITLAIVLALGGVLLVSAVWPDSAAARLFEHSGVAIVMIIVIGTSWFQTSLRRQGGRADAPEMRMVLEDEWRLATMDRARRVTLVVVLAAQVPLALALSEAGMTALRTALAMAIATVTLGMATLLSTFLFFDRR